MSGDCSLSSPIIIPVMNLVVINSHVLFVTGAFCQGTDSNLSLSVPAVSLQGVLHCMS